MENPLNQWMIWSYPHDSGNLKKSYLVLLNFRIPGPSFGIAQVNLTAIVSYTSCRNLILSAPDVLTGIGG